MAQPDMPVYSSLKNEVNCGVQTQCNVSDESWHIEMQSMFECPSKMWQVSENVCIYRVPKPIMISKRQAYTPLVVALGPYHHFNAEFSTMNSHKLEAVRRTLTRLQIDLSTLISEIQKFECNIRECYEESINFDGKALSRMMAMDACFIVEFFRSNEAIAFSLVFQNNNTMFSAIMNDIMKVENQIPLFILLALLELEFKSREDATTKLAELLSVYNVFNGFPFSVSRPDSPNTSELKRHIEKERPPRHLLDLSRLVVNDLLISTSAESGIAVETEITGIAVESDRSGGNNDHGRCWRSMNMKLPDRLRQLNCMNMFPRLDRNLSFNEVSIPSAYLLGQAGIEFKPGQLGFEKGISGKRTVLLPEVHLWDSTETVLRNLMVFEECQYCSWFPEDKCLNNSFYYENCYEDLNNSIR
ncbi:hypothetical protein SUGI_0693420 [Cryptomeria japonica]|nr:hypothetical protein SUGI_0693420 [Cryptomeria japonica]